MKKRRISKAENDAADYAIYALTVYKRSLDPKIIDGLIEMLTPLAKITRWENMTKAERAKQGEEKYMTMVANASTARKANKKEE